MEKFDLYRDIAERTDGDIYIGVVGPVRTGKSTLIKNSWIYWFCRIWKTVSKRNEQGTKCLKAEPGVLL